jgi:cell division protein FtsB
LKIENEKNEIQKQKLAEMKRRNDLLEEKNRLMHNHVDML